MWKSDADNTAMIFQPQTFNKVNGIEASCLTNNIVIWKGIKKLDWQKNHNSLDNN